MADILFALAYPVLKSWKWTHGDDGPFMLGNFIGITFIVLFLQVGSLHCLLVRVHVRVHVRKRIPAVGQCVRVQ